jgi:hypothetical protein
MHARRAAISVLLVAASTTACSGSGSGSGSSSSDKPDAKAAPATAKPSAKSTPSASTGPLKFGAGHGWSDTDTDGSHISGTTTVMGYSQPAEGVTLPDQVSSFPNPDWAVLDVKVCAAGDSTTVMVAQQPWSLGYSDDTRLAAPNISGSGVAEPAYSVDGAAVKPGTCYRGNITFDVKRGTRPNQIIYAVDGRDPIVWTVPKA